MGRLRLNEQQDVIASDSREAARYVVEFAATSGAQGEIGVVTVWEMDDGITVRVQTQYIEPSNLRWVLDALGIER